MDTFFDGVWRMDWGFGNPNKTAALVAMLMVGVWVLGWFRKWGFWVAGALFTGLGLCLIHTFSRGGLLAAMIGVAPLLWVCGRCLSKAQWTGLACSLAVLIGFAFLLNANQRFTQGIAGEEDASISNRLALWKSAPRMMLDAPGGWGLGNSGEAFMQWYQDPEHLEGYRTLVNSHLTWLVELNWIGRILYVAGWGLVFLVVFPSGGNAALAGALGVWASFFVSATFSSVAESIWLWFIPDFALVFAFAIRIRHRLWFTWRSIASVLGSAFAALLLFVLLGSYFNQSVRHAIQRQGAVVFVGHPSANTWIVVNKAVLGRFYGKTWRRFVFEEEASVAFVASPYHLPDSSQVRTVALAGKLSGEEVQSIDERRTFMKLILLNPGFGPDEISNNSDVIQVIVHRGAFFVDSWNTAWDQALPTRVNVVQGAAEYLPEWPRLLISENLQEDLP